MTLQRGLGSKKKGIEALEEEEDESILKGAPESGSGDGNSSPVFTMSPETYEFLGQCVREHMLRSRPRLTHSLRSVDPV